MKKDDAVQRAGSAANLARILGISIGTVKKWGDEVPDKHEQELRILRPEWFGRRPLRPAATHYERLLLMRALATVMRRLAL